MLNISHNTIQREVRLNDFGAYTHLKKSHTHGLPRWLSISLVIALFIFIFLPWTQNISSKGYVTTRSPEQRPQAIPSVIAGRIEHWYVREGDFVNKGDTIVFISEVKGEYFDPELLTRTSEQLDAKSQSIESYDRKVAALQTQYSAIKESLGLKREQTINKIQQARNKISMDSIDLVAYRTNQDIALNQLARTRELHEKGLKTLTELQDKEYKVQAASAAVSVQENKLLIGRNELVNLKLELQAIDREYEDKLAKSLSEQQSAISSRLESVAATSKLKNEFSTYTERQKFYHITAPQSGYITRTIKKGIGETVKEGEDIVTIMPDAYELAVEIYVRPQDVPLLQAGEGVRLRFDGWPAIVISGWPKASTGVFSGRIVAIEKFISDNGYYRVLISPDADQRPWPDLLSVGSGVHAFILLKEVPVWYEVWRLLNGFPPDFYRGDKSMQSEIKTKAPLKSVK